MDIARASTLSMCRDHSNFLSLSFCSTSLWNASQFKEVLLQHSIQIARQWTVGVHSITQGCGKCNAAKRVAVPFVQPLQSTNSGVNCVLERSIRDGSLLQHMTHVDCPAAVSHTKRVHAPKTASIIRYVKVSIGSLWWMSVQKRDEIGTRVAGYT